jgi:hypothetical protein
MKAKKRILEAERPAPQALISATPVSDKICCIRVSQRSMHARLRALLLR